MTQSTLLLAYAALFIVTGLGASHAFAWPLWLGFTAGLAAGSLPVWLPILAPQFTPTRCVSLASLVCLSAIGVAICIWTLAPLLTDEPTRIEASMPLLPLTAAHYLIHLFVNRIRMVENDTASVMQRLAFVFSGPPLLLSLAMATILTTYALLLIDYIGSSYTAWEFLRTKFLDRGIIPPLTLALFFWGGLLLTSKFRLLRQEHKSFTVADHTSGSLLTQAYQQLKTQQGASPREEFMALAVRKSADFYIIPNYINWAIPILGFIGTVLGISLAADGIHRAFKAQASISGLSSELGDIIAPIGIAFDTTLIALSLSVFLRLVQTSLLRWENAFLTEYANHIRHLPGS